jgi:hypothetical protein
VTTRSIGFAGLIAEYPCTDGLCGPGSHPGGHLIVDFRPGDDGNWNLQNAFYEIAGDKQLDFFPDAYRRSY